ncbi:MAG: antitoxin MazE family protein [Rubrivivax sp.]|nr:antitoxin MazE family protein [Rubrivivax sp.]
MTSPVAQRVQKHREALRAAGLRPVQIWVPDTRRRGFSQKCRRQSQSLLVPAAAAAEEGLEGWLRGVADTDGWR